MNRMNDDNIFQTRREGMRKTFIGTPTHYTEAKITNHKWQRMKLRYLYTIFDNHTRWSVYEWTDETKIEWKPKQIFPIFRFRTGSRLSSLCVFCQWVSSTVRLSFKDRSAISPGKTSRTSEGPHSSNGTWTTTRWLPCGGFHDVRIFLHGSTSKSSIMWISVLELLPSIHTPRGGSMLGLLPQSPWKILNIFVKE